MKTAADQQTLANIMTNPGGGKENDWRRRREKMGTGAAGTESLLVQAGCLR
jgi:hypothetical protein